MNNYEQMREALEEARDALDTIMSTSCHNLREITASRAYRKCREALALPPRQCDIGTAEEQNERFDKMCFPLLKMGMCKNCRLYNIQGSCELAWAQTPYAEEGGAE